MITLKGYQNTDKIYESDHSLIYRARDEKNQQPVILKILNTKYAASEELFKFTKEFELMKQFETSGITETYNMFKVDNSPAIAMEDIGGHSLSDVLRTKKLTITEFLFLAIKIADILGRIHSRNIIHKDINPSNIIWNEKTDVVQIIDFGISTELPREIKTIKNPRILEGTPAFISPEQTGRMNRAIDYRTDFYSLGVTFYVMLTGRLPFDFDDLLKLIHSHIAILPTSPREIDPDIPEIVSNIIMKLMAKNAEDRYLSAHGIKADLLQCEQQLQDKGVISNFELGMHDVSDKFQIPQKLYGRETETNLLMSGFQSVCQGMTELMVVSGYSGVGKSVLIHEIQQPVVKYHGYFISGKFEKLKKDVPYSAFIQAFTNLAKQILAENDETIAFWKEKLNKALGPNGKIVTDMLPLFELILGKQEDIPELGPVESQNRFYIVLQNFIKALAGKDHPLVLFMDDFQWGDTASLHLLKLFTTTPNIKYLFIITAYRHNQVSDGHPMVHVLEEIKKNGTIVNTIFLKPLTQAHINQLLSDTLNRPIAETSRLGEILIKKTNGNPFFINEFLKMLYKKNLIRFSFEHGWSWQIQEIENIQVTDNVGDLMAGKITNLPEDAQEILKIGACIGNPFDLPLLTTISEKPEKEILSTLKIILQEGLLNQIDNTYRFSHDRIMEAAYSLIPDEKKARQHYHIGKLVLNKTKQDDLPDKIFYIVNHLNAGNALITNASEKNILAGLNLSAGRKALRSSAYGSALIYLKTGINLLEKNTWQTRYEFTLALYEEAVMAAQLSAEYDLMEAFAQTVIQHAEKSLDTIKTRESQIFSCVARNQIMDGIRIGLDVLSQLGVNVPEKPGNIRIAYELLRTKISIKGTDIETLINLPKMSDPHKLAVMQILSSVISSAYYVAPELLAVLVLKSVRFSVKYGNCVYSPYAYAVFGLIHCGILGQINAGYKWGRLAADLVNKENLKETKAKVWIVIWFLINIWKQSLRNSLEPLLEAYKTGLETGDLEFAASAAHLHSWFLLFSGMNLPQTEKTMAMYTESIRQLNQDIILNYQLMTHQMVVCLKGGSTNPKQLIGHSYDYKKMLPKHQDAKEVTAISMIYTYLMMLNYFFDDYEAAFENAETAGSYLMTAGVSSYYIPLFVFFDSLIRLELYHQEKRSGQKKHLKQVIKNQRKIKKWAQYAPVNFLHKYHLVEAEIARISGHEQDARKHYNIALNHARKNEFLYEQAMILELTAKFWMGINEEEIASIYMTKAHHVYRAWGATAKLTHMKKIHGRLLTLLPQRTTTSTTATTDKTNTGLTSSDSIDLTTVMKTSQTLSSEIDLTKLMKAIMMFSIENAGAHRGFLIIENEDSNTLNVEAEYENSDTITVLKSIPLNQITARLSTKIISYVNRTNETVALNNACKEGNFTDDPYIIDNKVKSVLCIPIIHKGKTSGILYLENNLATNAFTRDRIDLLRLTTAQAAISIENARLVMHRENAAKLEKEMEIAANIQTNLIPEKPTLKGYDISAYMLPANEVGGDYYDVINTGKRDWIIIGDVSGHGVHAGLIMMMVQTAIHVVLSQHPDLPPNELLTIVNKTITKNIQQMGENKYMTITVLAVHEDGCFSFSGLHQDIMIYRKCTRNIELVNTDGLWLGITDDISELLTVGQFSMDVGDVMLVYTDGITEAWEKNNKNETFGDERLQKTLSQSGEGHVEDIKDAVIDALKGYTTKDDVTLVILKRK